MDTRMPLIMSEIAMPCERENCYASLKDHARSYHLGADLVAILMVTAWINDHYHSAATVERIAKYAGQSRSTISGKVKRLVELGWLANAGTIGTARAYRV